MKTFTADELKAVLAAHLKWLRGEAGGARANLMAQTFVVSARGRILHALQETT